MKLSFVYTIFIVGIAAFLSLGNDGGRAGEQNWGNTGAPGDQMAGGQPATCLFCHSNSADIQVLISLEMKDASGTVITSGEYIPGATYGMTATLDVVSGTPAGYGFQMLGLNAAIDVDGPEVSNYSNPASNVQIASASMTGRTYAEHLGVSPTPDFNVDWTAPEAGAGPITFYLCGNGVNGDGSSGSDNAACTKVELAEGMVSGTHQIAGLNELLVSPNPSQGDFVLSFKNTEAIDGQLLIQDISGKLLHSEALSVSAGTTLLPVAFDAPAAGLYFVQLQTNEGLRTEKLMVQ